MIGKVKQSTTSKEGTTTFMDSSTGNSNNDTFNKSLFITKNARVRLPSIQKVRVAAEAPLFVQQYDHASKAGRKKFVEAVSRELLTSRSRRLKPYRYSSSSEEEL